MRKQRFGIYSLLLLTAAIVVANPILADRRSRGRIAYTVPDNIEHWSGHQEMSPDGKYYVDITPDSGTVAVLSIRSAKKRDQVMVDNIVNATSYVWVPTKPHCLVFATRGDFGDSGIAKLQVWSGVNNMKLLLKAKKSHDECFVVYSVNRDGSAVTYGHANHLNTVNATSDMKKFERMLKRRHVLILTR
jgi:hypothetical protein